MPTVAEQLASIDAVLASSVRASTFHAMHPGSRPTGPAAHGAGGSTNVAALRALGPRLVGFAEAVRATAQTAAGGGAQIEGAYTYTYSCIQIHLLSLRVGPLKS